MIHIPEWARDLIEPWEHLSRWVRGGILFAAGCVVGALFL
jgi:hypothetical protein